MVESGRFDWGNGNFPRMTEPVAVLRRAVVVGQLRRVRVLHAPAGRAAARPRPGAVAVQRLPAAAGRRDAAPADGRPPRQRRAVADVRCAAPRRSSWVRWAGLPTIRTTSAAQRYLPHGPGRGVLVRRRGGRAGGRTFIEALELCSHLANIGDVRTLVIHPASTTHQQLVRRGARRPAACRRDLVRISVGIEDPDDIIWDLDQALDRGGQGREHDAMTRRPGRHPTAARAPRHPPRDARPSPSSACRPTRAGPATSSPPTCCRRVARSTTSGSSTRRAARSSAGRCTGRSPSCRRRPISSTCSAAPTTSRRSPRSSSPLAGTRTFWAQLGLHSDEAVASSRDAGRDAVMNRCLKIEHARFRGGLHTAGFDTGVISSRRHPDL